MGPSVRNSKSTKTVGQKDPAASGGAGPLPLELSLAGNAPVFHSTPVEVLFAVLLVFLATEKHASSNHCLQNGHKGVGRHHKHF
jgi:hypothetical protein